MRIREKVNLTKYIFLTALTTLGFMLIVRSPNEAYALIVAWIGTIINQLMLCKAVLMMIENSKDSSLQGGMKSRNWAIAGLMVGKIVILFIAFYIGVHLMGNRVIIPVFNYTLQIGALGLSLRKD